MAKKKKVKSTATKTGSKPINKLKSTLLNGSLVCLLILIACFTYLALVESPAINQANIKARAQTLANSQVSLLDQALNQLRLRLSHLALSEQWISAIDNDDQEAITRYQQELVRAFPEAASAKLITLGHLGIAALNMEKYGLNNNIELDLLRHVSNGNNVEPEAYRIDNQWLFSLAEPLRSGNKTYASGALFITLNEQYLKTLLSQLDSSLGQTSLIQQFRNKQHLITSSGTSGGGGMKVTADASVSHWQIIFSPSAELIAGSLHSANLIWILLAVSALSLIAVTCLINKTLHKQLATNLAGLLPTAKNGNGFTLPGFKATAEQLSSKAAPAKAHAPAEPAVAVTATAAPADDQPDLPTSLPESIFRAYDIRGHAKQQLTDQVVYAIGLAIGSEALDQGQQSVVVSADGRNSSPRIHDALVQGLMDSGRDVIDIGTQPTPLMYFATHQLGTQSGVMITGSHNPAEDNGIKIVIAGRTLSGPAVQALRKRITDRQLASGQGRLISQEIEQDYIDYIINDVAIAQPLKIVIDAGNGVAGKIAPRLFEELGCEVIQLYCEVDGNFPNHHPDPTVEANLKDLKMIVQEQQADLGIAFDGDGDRLGVVTATGQYVAADILLMLLAQDVVSRNPGADVLFDVKCTRNLNTLISNYGGRPIMWKTGHSFMKDKMAETGALLGGEFSGHIFFKERWFGFDDGMYAAARLIEILSTSDPDLDLQLSAFPSSIGSPELKVATSDSQKFTIIDQLIETGQFDDGKISTLDGLRVDYPDGWGLVRPSNTTPMLIFRFEADSEQALERIKNQFKTQLSDVDNSLQFGF